jgi:hypothetical protein
LRTASDPSLQICGGGNSILELSCGSVNLIPFTLPIPEGITFKSSHADKSISVMFSFSQFSIRSRVDCFLILKVVPILNPVEKNLIRTHSTTQNTHQNQLNELRQHLPKQVFHHLQFDCLQKEKELKS